MPQITRVSAPSFPIVDTTTLQQWLRIDDGVDAPTLAMLLAGATDYLEGLTGRVLAQATYRVTIDPCERSLGITPVNTIMTVTANLADGTAQALVLGTDYAVSPATGNPSISLLQPIANLASLTVLCSAGYQSAASVPAVLQQAAAVLVAAGYDNRSALDPRTIATVGNLIQRYRAVGI